MENKWVLKNKYKYKGNNIRHKHQKRARARNIYANTDIKEEERSEQLETRDI